MAEDRTIADTRGAGDGLPARAGKYRITGRVGEGGMGVVYRAVDEDLGRTVALKFIPEHLAGDTAAGQRFLREARAASALDHVNIGTIFGVEEMDDRRRFIVMAYYEGQNLSARIRDESRPMAAAEAIEIAIQVAQGLSEAHARAVTHRDIKPSNILITTQGVVKIVDFGLASMGDAGQLTRTGDQLGTPAYMSPEQVLGAAADHRSDIWSLGVVIYEMLTGRRLFASDSVPAVLYQVVHGELEGVRRMAPAVRAVLERALERDPDRRYQSMAEFLRALRGLEEQTAGMGPAPGGDETLVAPQPAARARKRRFSGKTLAAGLALIGLAAAGGTLWVQRPAGPARPAANPGSQTPSAYEKYMEGLALLKRWDKQGHLDKAMKAFTDATALDPRFALAFARLADAQRIRYALTRDRSWLDAAVKNAEEANRLNPELSPVQVALGRVHAARGNDDLALAALEKALQADANDADANQAIARHYEKLGRLKEADERYERAVALDPDNLGARDSFANSLFRRNRYDEAITHWQAVIRIAPDHAPAHVNLGSALSQQGRIAESITIFEKAAELNPAYMAYSNLGTAYSRAARHEDAVKAFRKALDIDESDSMVWGNLASVYSWMKGKDAEAKDAFARAIGLAEAARRNDPRNAYLNADLAGYYAKTGRPALADERLNTALTLAPQSAEIQVVAAEVNEILQRREAGIRHAKRALELGFAAARLQRNQDLAGLMKDPRMRPGQ